MATVEQDCLESSLQYIRGLPFPNKSWFKRETIESGMDYAIKDRDVIIASYPKTGTTWMQYIVSQITSKGTFFPKLDFYKMCPYLELVGAEAIEALTGDRIYSHHFPYDKIRKNSKAKTIYIYRNPEDTIVSFYHYSLEIGYGNYSDINEYFDDFVEGKVPYGNYFEHVLSFYEHRGDKNLLLVSYEVLHANRKNEILRIAEFLGEEYKKTLSEEGDILDKIIEKTSFEYMKKNLFLTHYTKKNKVEFFRKGIVGDGRNVLTDDQRNVLKIAAKKVLENTSLYKEWYPEEK